MVSVVKLIQKRGLSCTLKKIKRRFFINDSAVVSLVSRLGAYDYLQKYAYILSRPQHAAPLGSNPYPDKIWVCWLQGIEHAPPVVQKCVATMKSLYGSDEVILLDSKNIFNYIEIPEYVTDKWRKGIIGNAHFADVVRILLLAQYGGMWIDSTTLLLDKAPQHVRSADLFCFKGRPIAYVSASNWFIVAKPNNRIILTTRDLLLEYWRKENKLASYSIFHLFFTMAINSSQEVKRLWKAVPYFDDVNCKALQNELFDTFSEVRLEQIRQMSPMQKLSYKFTAEEFGKKGTFYDTLIGREEKRREEKRREEKRREERQSY